MRKIFVTLIIALLPVFVLAREGEVHFVSSAGTLPGQAGYFFERIGEWLDVNIFTISTKAKQQKRLDLADERVAEIIQLGTEPDTKSRNFGLAVGRYQNFLRQAEDMAEKIIVLDGKEIGLADKFEYTSRLHETLISQVLASAPPKIAGIIQEALTSARLGNEKIFKFMVVNYQFTDEDIKKHQDILEQHFEIVEKFNREENEKVEEYLDEARKYQKAGLNVQAYDLLQRAKNILY